MTHQHKISYTHVWVLVKNMSRDQVHPLLGNLCTLYIHNKNSSLSTWLKPHLISVYYSTPRSLPAVLNGRVCTCHVIRCYLHTGTTDLEMYEC